MFKRKKGNQEVPVTITRTSRRNPDSRLSSTYVSIFYQIERTSKNLFGEVKNLGSGDTFFCHKIFRVIIASHSCPLQTDTHNIGG